ncbi:MAG: cupredoxin family copper-binding protein [Gemmatimonadaceae bacterium]
MQFRFTRNPKIRSINSNNGSKVFVSFLTMTFAACGSDKPTEAGTQPPVTGGSKVQIANFAFAPAAISVARGTTVTWTNTDAAVHTISADSGTFDSGTLAQNKTFQFVADKAGTFTYFCRIHAFMHGTVIVTP